MNQKKVTAAQSSFTEGKILLPLVRFALPVLLALCLQAMYGAVDLLVVGQFGSAADVSAVLLLSIRRGSLSPSLQKTSGSINH